MPEGWHQKVRRASNRIGYGITDRLEVGFSFHDWVGKAREIKEWPKSGWDYGDKVGYKFSDERDHKKLFGGVNIPYSSLNKFSPPVMLNIGFM